MSAPVVIVFHRFGPYHWARADACARRFPTVAVEESARSAEYQWTAAGSGAGLAPRTLLAAGERPTRPAREIARRLARLLDEIRPAAVAVPGWSDPAALGALAWGARRGVSIVLMSESSAGDEARRPWKEALKRRVVALGGAALAGGEPHREYLAGLGMKPERIFTGYDAVDNAHFAAGVPDRERAAERARLGLPERYFFASSRFVEKKNLSGLLAAYARYREGAGPDAWDLVLAGDGPLAADLRRQVDGLGLAKAVHLPGFRQYEELPAYYALAGAFVHASTTEQWGLVVNEAMAAGLPVIVSARCGCARDLVEGGRNGFTFDPAGTGTLAACLARVAALPPPERAAMGEASREIIRRWTPDNFAENLACAVAAAAPPRRAGLADRLLIAALLRLADRHAARLLPAASPP